MAKITKLVATAPEKGFQPFSADEVEFVKAHEGEGKIYYEAECKKAKCKVMIGSGEIGLVRDNHPTLVTVEGEYVTIKPKTLMGRTKKGLYLIPA